MCVHVCEQDNYKTCGLRGRQNGGKDTRGRCTCTLKLFDAVIKFAKFGMISYHGKAKVSRGSVVPTHPRITVLQAALSTGTCALTCAIIVSNYVCCHFCYRLIGWSSKAAVFNFNKKVSLSSSIYLLPQSPPSLDQFEIVLVGDKSENSLLLCWLVTWQRDGRELLHAITPQRHYAAYMRQPHELFVFSNKLCECVRWWNMGIG